MSRPTVVLTPNGDPYGSGFTGTLYDNPNENIGIYLGDVGARQRSYWRAYAKKHNYKLREWRPDNNNTKEV